MVTSLTIEGQTIDYVVVYKKRKTLGIYIDVYGNIELRVPRDTTDDQIAHLLQEKWQWIITRSQEMKERTKGFKKKDYINGETFLLLGREYPMTIVEGSVTHKDGIQFDGERLTIYTKIHDEASIQKLLKKFYKKQCKSIVEKRIRHYQPNFKSKPKSIRIASNKKTWGTCNSLREMTFNWKLAMAPIEVIDYIVIHEMCHMVHLNHDRSFWRLVGKHMPDYEKKEQWLKQSHWKMVV